MELLRQLPAFFAAVALICAVPAPAVALLISHWRGDGAGSMRCAAP